MNYDIERFSDCLRETRIAKHLSQRELSKLAGVPQSHISRIESNQVDLRLSSLIAIASTLELELALVPRTAMPAIRSIARQAAVTEAAKKMTAPRGQIVPAPSRAEPAVESKPAYTLDEDDH